MLSPSMVALSKPFQRGSQGWGTLAHQNHGAGGGNGSIMVGMFVCLCLVSKKPSEWEFFVPAGMDLGVKLLKARRIMDTPCLCVPHFLLDGMMISCACNRPNQSRRVFRAGWAFYMREQIEIDGVLALVILAMVGIYFA